jgi:hypothetical protein
MYPHNLIFLSLTWDWRKPGSHTVCGTSGAQDYSVIPVTDGIERGFNSRIWRPGLAIRVALTSGYRCIHLTKAADIAGKRSKLNLDPRLELVLL